MDIKRFELTLDEQYQHYNDSGSMLDDHWMIDSLLQAQITKVQSFYEPVELEAIDDEALLEMVKYIPNKITLCSAVIKATIQHNQSKGQLFRLKENE